MRTDTSTLLLPIGLCGFVCQALIAGWRATFGPSAVFEMRFPRFLLCQTSLSVSAPGAPRIVKQRKEMKVQSSHFLYEGRRAISTDQKVMIQVLHRALSRV